VSDQLQLLVCSGIAFFVMLPAMRRTLTITLDLDWFYRVLLVGAARELAGLWQHASRVASRWWQGTGAGWRGRLEGWFLPHGPLARTWPTGSMTLWVTVILVLLVVLAEGIA
jgi:multicomponent Na+:H+ antiporter subunit D